jgi:hypothetical protein
MSSNCLAHDESYLAPSNKHPFNFSKTEKLVKNYLFNYRKYPVYIYGNIPRRWISLGDTSLLCQDQYKCVFSTPSFNCAVYLINNRKYPVPMNKFMSSKRKYLSKRTTNSSETGLSCQTNNRQFLFASYITVFMTSLNLVGHLSSNFTE